MKRISYLFTLFTFLIPFSVQAAGTNKYYIDAYVNEDGSTTFKELVEFEGEYNYLERDLTLKGNTKQFTGKDADSFYKTDIYNATDIKDICVSSVDKRYLSNWQYVTNHNDCFELIETGYNGLSDYYTITKDKNKVNFKIYNPSTNNTAFYLEYTITDSVVIHNDIAELLFNFNWGEEISDVDIRINLSQESNELRVFSHGPITGNNKITDKKTVEANWDNLSLDTLVDVRALFDPSLVSKGTKLTNVNAMDNILKFEQEQADIQNNKRMEARIIYYFVLGILGLWIIGSIIFFIKLLKKNKRFMPDFNNEFLREIPYEYGPEILGYLLTKNNIQSEYLSASIMELIRRKVFTIEKSEKDNWVIKDNDIDKKLLLSDSEKNLKDWLINEVGNGSLFTNKDLKKASKKDATSFMTSFSNWKDEVIAEGDKQEFFQDESKASYVLYALLGVILLVISNLLFLSNALFNIIIIIMIIILLVYSKKLSKKKSQIGENHYARWQGLKKFMLEFGKMNDKEMPEVFLWEKYLVYATSLGIADKVEKDLKVKLTNIDSNGTMINNMPLFYYSNISFANSINSSVASSITSACTAQVANSSMSSGSGFGGGASFGGGGGGFGGGGGRG